jgi:hypothetical protein
MKCHWDTRAPIRLPLPTIDLGALLTAMLQVQADSQMAVAVANNANLIALNTATAQTLASKGGGNNEAKMTVAKKRILQACLGWGISPAFRTSPVYLEMEIKGSTTDALGCILCRLLKPASLPLHKSNICVTPHLVLTVKTLSFSSNGDNIRWVHKRNHHLCYPVAHGRGHE